MSRDEVTIPEWDEHDPASLESWFGPFGHAEHFRKVVLASCREAERARASVSIKHQEGSKMPSESRLDDLARTSDKYVDYLIATLNGRRLREANVLSSMAR